MGWFKDLGTSLKTTTQDTLASTYENSKDLYQNYANMFSGNAGQVDEKQLLKPQGALNNFSSSIMANTLPKSHTIDVTDYMALTQSRNSAFYNYVTSNSDNYNDTRFTQMPTKAGGNIVVDTHGSDILGFKIPDWSYADFINERAIWQKSLFSVGANPGWFYFKVFFNFDTQYGLLGGLLNNESYKYAANSAAKYLYYGSSLYVHERPNDRIEALHKFASILSYINTNTPWFFKSIKGLNNVQQPLLKDFSKERFIELECNVDSVDMRLNTLMDLYKFAVYDDINCKEIIPENLRKFDMSVVIFQTPIRYLHTSMNSETGGKFSYKTLSPINNGSSDGYDNVMSFKLYTFINCEIDPTSLGSMVPGDVKNETPFQMGNGTIKIKYDRVYQHTMNEFNEMLFGSDGFYYNRFSLWSSDDDNNSMIINARPSTEDNSQDKRYRALQHSLETAKMSSTDPASFKSLVDASEAICGHNLMKFGGNVLGNLAGAQDDLQIKHFDDNGKLLERAGDGPKPDHLSDYYKYKLRRIKEFATAGRGEDVSILSKLGASYLLGLLGASYDVMNSTLVAQEGTQHGFLYGYANTGIRRRMNTGVSSSDYQYSQYYKDKLALLHKKNKPGIVNFGSMPQNKTQLYISGIVDENDSFYGATLKDRTLTAEWDTRQSFISGAENTQVNSKYYKQKLDELNDGVVYTIDGKHDKITKKYIDGAGDKQLGSEYYQNKIDSMNDGFVSTSTTQYIAGAGDKQQGSGYADNKMDNLKHGDIQNGYITGSEDKQVDSDYQDEKLNNLIEGIFKNKFIAGAGDKQQNSDYADNKMDNLKHGDITNDFIAGAENTQVDSQYQDKKLDNIKDGTFVGKYIAGARQHQLGRPYYNEKLDDLKHGTVEDDYIAGSKDKQIGTKYNNEKLTSTKQGTAHNQYIAGSKDKQIGTKYNDIKLANTKQGTAGTQFITGAEDKQADTVYNTDKIHETKTGTIEDVYIAGTKNTAIYKKYYYDKLHALNDGIVSISGSNPSNQIDKYLSDENYDGTTQIPNLNVTHLTGAEEHEQLNHQGGTLTQQSIVTEFLRDKLEKLIKNK